VLLNLFSNALDAMSDVDPRARTLTIRTEIDAPDALLTIEDSGPGVAPAAAEQIFDAFYTTKADGTGMGLYLCRSIVEQHGGQVWASTAPSSGARFHVRLRLASSIPPVASGAIHPARLPESRLAERAERR
jgi:signal transduction histidine kinase